VSTQPQAGRLLLFLQQPAAAAGSLVGLQITKIVAAAAAVAAVCRCCR
jgi:hypothetical protein